VHCAHVSNFTPPVAMATWRDNPYMPRHILVYDPGGRHNLCVYCM
jgi:hypothetical protein